MPFGINTSPPNFEPITGSRIALATALFLDASLATKHSSWISQVSFAEPPGPLVVFTQVVPDGLNKGVLDAHGQPVPTPFNMYVDDNMYADVRGRMDQAIVASLESLFIILGHPHPNRRLALSVSKLTAAPASYRRVKL